MLTLFWEREQEIYSLHSTNPCFHSGLWFTQWNIPTVDYLWSHIPFMQIFNLWCACFSAFQIFSNWISISKKSRGCEIDMSELIRRKEQNHLTTWYKRPNSAHIYSWKTTKLMGHTDQETKRNTDSKPECPSYYIWYQDWQTLAKDLNSAYLGFFCSIEIDLCWMHQ